MSFDFPLSSVRHYTTDDLEVMWRSDFQKLVTTAIAAAERKVHAATSDRLRSEDWAEDWLDALTYAVAEIESAVERMTHSGDSRARRQSQRVKSLVAARDAARRRVKELRAARSLDGQSAPKITDAASLLLSLHFSDWFKERTRKLLFEKGVSGESHFNDLDSEDRLQMVERMVERGMLDYQETREVRRLRALSDFDFRNTVAEDVGSPSRRITALRHPLMLNDWMAALQDLQESTWKRMGYTDDPHSTLPAIDYQELAALSVVDSEAILRRRRFYRSVIQRMEEWRRIQRHLYRQAEVRRREIDAPWIEAAESVTKEIPAEFPGEYRAVCDALTKFALPSRPELLNPAYRKNRKEIHALLLGSLRDGSWERLSE